MITCTCKYCNREYPKNQIGGHTAFCTNNPNREKNLIRLGEARKNVKYTNEEYVCEYCGKILNNKGNLIHHTKHCKENPNHIISSDEKAKKNRKSRKGICYKNKMSDEGRKNIYLLSTIRKYTVNDCKEAGYEKAMKEAGLESHIFRTSGDTTINRKQFESYFVGNDVDGVIAVRDSIAVSFMNVMLNKGVKVPEDISIVGFQNTKYALLSRPNLTCIDIPVYDIGAVSMRLLTKLMNGEDNTETNVVLPHRIIIRGTTK